MKFWQLLLGLALGILICLFPLNQFQTSPLEPLQTLAVQLDGRKKPLDTVAQETVAQIHGSTSYQTTSGETLNDLDIYLSLWFNDRDWNEEPFILLSYRPLKKQVGLEVENKYFTFEEIVNSDLNRVLQRATQKQAQEIELTRNEREALTLEERLALMLKTVGADPLPLVPHPQDSQGTWVTLSNAQQYYPPEQVIPILENYDTLKQIYLSEPEHLSALGQVATTLQQQLRHLSPQVYPIPPTLQREVTFSHLHPFGKAWVLYSIAFVVMLLVLLFPSFDFYGGAMGLFLSGFLVQGYGFFSRMQIAERPPVTNMYESVIWVGFGIAAIALLFEGIYQAKYYLLAAAPLSVLCLILADNLPAVLDPSIKPLVPVLRDNFWLSIHVPTITLSYASFALAFGLGHILLGHYFFTPQASEPIKNLAKWNYGVLQVGVLLLATGIILGGIWAHFSWGRFWGWDPKETWALIALMCYVVPLHGRLVGWFGDFAMAVTSVVSFNAVLMAWYGVNFVLGTGLHSYGFSTGGSELIIASCVACDLLWVILVALKHKEWAIFDS